MEKEFIPYEQALALKELGFDEPCFGYYLNEKLNIFHSTSVKDRINSKTKDIFNSVETTSPLYSQAFRWFREKYDLHENVGIKHFIEKTYCYSIVSTSIPHYIHDKSHFASYEEAELECLKKLIEIVKNKLWN